MNTNKEDSAQIAISQRLRSVVKGYLEQHKVSLNSFCVDNSIQYENASNFLRGTRYASISLIQSFTSLMGIKAFAIRVSK